DILAAHGVLAPLAGRVPRRRNADSEARLLVTEYLPGSLVAGTVAEGDPDTYRQAGELLGILLIPGDRSSDYPSRMRDKAHRLLEKGSGSLIDVRDADRLRRRLESVALPDIRLYFTHGDYQPRNWL